LAVLSGFYLFVRMTFQLLCWLKCPEYAKKMYTHFKKGKNCITIVMLNIYR
jgi:hypothetical protein